MLALLVTSLCTLHVVGCLFTQILHSLDCGFGISIRSVAPLNKICKQICEENFINMA